MAGFFQVLHHIGDDFSGASRSVYQIDKQHLHAHHLRSHVQKASRRNAKVRPGGCIGFLGFAVRFYLFSAVIIAVTDYLSPMAAGVPVMPDACARIFSMQFSFVFALWNCSAND